MIRRRQRLLVPSAALLWGFQTAFLTPSMALILVTLFDASASEVGWALAAYNASGFVSALVLPAYADRKGNYLRLMVVCGLLTALLALVLFFSTSLQVALVALVIIGGPAGVGGTMLYAHLRHAGGSPADLINTRAIGTFAWVAGPPVATFIMGWFGNRSILAVIAGVALLGAATSALLLSRSRRADPTPPRARVHDDHTPLSRLGVVLIVVAFVILQATNATVVSVLAVFVTESLQVDVVWAGIALGVAAGLEIPALLLIGRLSARFSSLALVASGSVVGVVYYIGITLVTSPIVLIALQPLNAWFFAAVVGVGLTLFQQVIPRPGLATGLNSNTRKIGAIVSGGIIALGALTPLGYRGIFAVCAALTVLALGVLWAASRTARPGQHPPSLG